MAALVRPIILRILSLVTRGERKEGRWKLIKVLGYWERRERRRAMAYKGKGGSGAHCLYLNFYENSKSEKTEKKKKKSCSE